MIGLGVRVELIKLYMTSETLSFAIIFPRIVKGTLQAYAMEYGHCDLSMFTVYYSMVTFLQAAEEKEHCRPGSGKNKEEGTDRNLSAEHVASARDHDDDYETNPSSEEDESGAARSHPASYHPDADSQAVGAIGNPESEQGAADSYDSPRNVASTDVLQPVTRDFGPAASETVLPSLISAVESAETLVTEREEPESDHADTDSQSSSDASLDDVYLALPLPLHSDHASDGTQINLSAGTCRPPTPDSHSPSGAGAVALSPNSQLQGAVGGSAFDSIEFIADNDTLDEQQIDSLIDGASGSM